ncbi:MAG: hypothetical protein K6B45_10585, partial [Bacteroidaceae bacterium]|nr:hypothetical protein [Bacteroidaceae bacterium]
INKTENIRRNLLGDFGEPLYDFDDYMFVLDTGLSTDYFKALPKNDFGQVVAGIAINFPNK